MSHLWKFPLQSVGDVFSSFMMAVGAAEKVLQLIRRQPGIVPIADLKPQTFSGALSLENVKFAYPLRPSTPVLNSLSFTIKPGEVSFKSHKIYPTQK